MKKPSFSHSLFWDTDVNIIDWEKNANAVIIRILERGNLDDFRELRRVYTENKIKDAAKSARYLSERTLSFVSFFFETPLNEFQCYKNRQYQIPLLNF